LLTILVTIFLKLIRLFLINRFALRLSIKYISQIIFAKACFLFLISKKNIKTITYLLIQYLILFRLQIVIDKIIICIKILDI